eukprot:2871278-Alexandrium_andersonii.AAC.1
MHRLALLVEALQLLVEAAGVLHGLLHLDLCLAELVGLQAHVQRYKPTVTSTRTRTRCDTNTHRHKHTGTLVQPDRR